MKFRDVAVGARFFQGCNEYIKASETEAAEVSTWESYLDDEVRDRLPTREEKLAALESFRAHVAASPPNRWCSKHREWTGSDDEQCDECRYEIAVVVERRAALTRALTAQAWAVACALEDDVRDSRFTLSVVNPSGETDAHEYEEGMVCGAECAMDAVAALPAPATLADEILGGTS